MCTEQSIKGALQTAMDGSLKALNRDFTCFLTAEETEFS